MNNDLQSKLSALENLIKIQTNCLEEGYMHGMLNGLIVAHAVFTGDHPTYVKMPRKKTKVRHTRTKKT